ncbi:MAG: ATP-binding protein [Acidobacteriota bacterium]
MSEAGAQRSSPGVLKEPACGPDSPIVRGTAGGRWGRVWDWLRRASARISIRLLAFNMLLVFLPAAGLLYLDTFERQLLIEQERSMVQQGRLLAAALSSGAALDQAAATLVLERLDMRLDARIRIVDRDRNVLADSSLLGPSRRGGEEASGEELSARRYWSYRLGALLYRAYVRLFHSRPESPEPADLYVSATRAAGPEVQAALDGRYGATTRISGGGQRSVNLYSAIPIRSGGQVIGAVLVSQSTFRILQSLYEVRIDIFRVFLVSVAAAAMLSLLLSTTIAHPLKRLRSQAGAILDRRGRLTGHFKGSRRSDEIGDLARALEELTRRLEERMRLVEAFAADVSHEFRNPLAAIRTAVEVLQEVEDPGERRRFVAIVEREVARLEHLLADAREVARIDAGLHEEPPQPVALNALLEDIVSGYRLRLGDRCEFEVSAPREPVLVRSSPERLTQALENLLDNGVSFSPPRGKIRVTMAVDRRTTTIAVSDQGPGIPEQHMSRIFERFFTCRPDADRSAGDHTGLGLSIARSIIEAYGGSIRAANNAGGGATFTIELPLSH